MFKYLKYSDAPRVREVDKDIKNKFNFSWLDREVDRVKLSSFIKKVDLPGKAVCTVCKGVVNYGGRGFSSLAEHAKGKKHVQKVKDAMSNYSMEYMVGKTEKATVLVPGPNSDNQPSSSTVRPVAMFDRVSNAEAMVLGVVAEHSLSFTMAPVMIDLAKALAKDPKALGMLSMDRTSAGYKMTHGLGRVIEEDLWQSMRDGPFSINTDEATGKNNKKVLTFLVSFYNKELGKVTVSHLSSVEVYRVTADTIFRHLQSLFLQNNVPWSNLVSILMDSCSVMRGSKNGVEAKIREVAPHLLNIDGDSCHHIHNCCKEFCKPFEYWVEDLFTNLHTDFKWSPDMKEGLSEICELVGVKYTVPERFVSHRWLSAYDLANSTIRLWHVLKIFYFSFLSSEDKDLYSEQLVDIFVKKKVSTEARKRIREIQREMMAKKKGMTSDGKKRKQRIVEKIFYNSMKTELQLNFYVAALHLLKDYVMVFQSKESLVHQLHTSQIQVFKQFLGNFVKSEYVRKKSPRQLEELDLTEDNDQFLDIADMYVGHECDKIVSSLGKKDSSVLEFRKQAAAAYVKCGQYMQRKLPLNNKTLTALASLDPELHGHSATAIELKKLTNFFSFLLTEDEIVKVKEEIVKFHVDDSISTETDTDVVRWWVDIGRKYETLGKIALAALTIFHGPQVESSFNIMKDIADPGSSNMKISTYSSIQSVKYKLRNEKKTAIQMFSRSDPIFDPVNLKLCRGIRSAASVMRKQQRKKQEDKKHRMELFKVPSGHVLSKKSATKEKIACEERARLAHLSKERKKARKRALEQLAASRRKQNKLT